MRGRKEEEERNGEDLALLEEERERKKQKTATGGGTVKNTEGGLKHSSALVGDLFFNAKVKKKKKKEVECEVIPVDWGLKTALKLSSRRPLRDVLELMDKDMLYFVSPSEGVSTDYEIAFYQNTFQRGRLDIDIQILKNWNGKIKNWLESFDSIFLSFLKHQCPYFYTFFKYFAVLFLTPGIADCKSFLAIINRSSKTIRDKLSASGIQFSMPLFKPHTPTPSDSTNPTNSPTSPSNTSEDLDKHFAALGKLAPGQTRLNTAEKNLDFKHETAVYIKGREQLLLLFQFLKNEVKSSNCYYSCSSKSSIGDSVNMALVDLTMPVIYGRVPFLNCTLRKLTLQFDTVITQNEFSNQPEIQHTVSISRGPIFPDTILNLTNKLRDHNIPFTAHFLKKMEQQQIILMETSVFNEILGLSWEDMEGKEQLEEGKEVLREEKEEEEGKWMEEALKYMEFNINKECNNLRIELTSRPFDALNELKKRTALLKKGSLKKITLYNNNLDNLDNNQNNLDNHKQNNQDNLDNNQNNLDNHKQNNQDKHRAQQDQVEDNLTLKYELSNI